MNKTKLNKIIGIDLSLTSTGISVYTINGDITTKIDNLSPTKENILVHDSKLDTYLTKTIKTTNKISTYERYCQIIEGINNTIEDSTYPFLVIEGYSFGSFGKSSAMSNLIELGGIIKFLLRSGNKNFIVVPPTVLKKFTTGSGSSKKEDMKLSLYKKYAVEFKTSDEADAFALMMFGLKYLGMPNKFSLRITNTEQECFKKLGEREWE